MVNLNDLYKWFDENRDAIIANHVNECVLLKGNSVIGYYPNAEDALSDAEKNGFVMGDFLIQDCISDEEDTMMYYNQAVSFVSSSRVSSTVLCICGFFMVAVFPCNKYT